MSFHDVDALLQQESEWIKIGVDTGGKTAWPQSVTYGRSFLVVLTSLSTQRLESLSNLVRVRGVQAPVCKPLLSVGEYTTMGGVAVLHGDKVYMFHKGSNIAKKIDAWIQKEMRDSQHYGWKVAYKDNVYNVKPRGNKTDVMPLSEDSDNRSLGRVAGPVRTCKTGESRSKRSRRSTRSNAR